MGFFELDEDDENSATAYDEDLQKDLDRQNKAGLVDIKLAQEVLAILNEINGDDQYLDTSGQEKYINWETTDIPYRVLRRAGATEAGRLIKNKRRLDFAQYARPPKENGIQRGCKLVFKNPEYSPTKEEKQRLMVWQDRIFRNFFFAANDLNPSFVKFIGNAYEDFFDLDDITIEVRRDGLGNPLSMHLADPVIWKPVVKDRITTHSIGFEGEDEIISDMLSNYDGVFKELIPNLSQQEKPDYLLLYNNQRIASAFRDTVRKHHFFTRSNFRYAQRGFSIVEQAMNLMSWITNSLTLNASNFTRNHVPQGLLVFTGGGISQMQLERLKKVLRAHQTGPDSQNKFPAASLKGEKADAKWLNFRNNSREMEYHLWITLLFSLYCQFSGTDPREVSMGAHSEAVKASSLNSESTDGIVKESNDNGARTFLNQLADSLNETDKDGLNEFEKLIKLPVELQFVGFEVEDRKAKMEIVSKELATVKSRNDKLAEFDHEKYELMIDIGEEEKVNYFDIPGTESQQLHQIIMGKIQMASQAAMQQQQMGAQGGEQQQGGEQLTDKDKELINQYDQEGAEVEDELRNKLSGGEGENQNPEV